MRLYDNDKGKLLSSLYLARTIIYLYTPSKRTRGGGARAERVSRLQQEAGNMSVRRSATAKGWREN